MSNFKTLHLTGVEGGTKREAVGRDCRTHKFCNQGISGGENKRGSKMGTLELGFCLFY